MYRVTYQITGEYDEYTSVDLSEVEYATVSKFIENLNADSQSVQIKEYKKEQING